MRAERGERYRLLEYLVTGTNWNSQLAVLRISFQNILAGLHNAQPFCLRRLVLYDAVRVFVCVCERDCVTHSQLVYSAGLASSFFGDPSPQ